MKYDIFPAELFLIFESEVSTVIPSLRRPLLRRNPYKAYTHDYLFIIKWRRNCIYIPHLIYCDTA